MHGMRVNPSSTGAASAPSAWSIKGVLNRRQLLRGGLALAGAVALGISETGMSEEDAPFGTGPGAFPLAPVYEVSLEYFPGHSFQELTAQMPRLAALGIGTIYLTPIFECAGLAQYLILDYKVINRRYGTVADLKSMVKAAHAHGIEVLLDLVTSLTTDSSYIMKRHPEWLLHGDDGKVQRYYPYPSWGWALDATNPDLIRYFTGVTAFYVREFDIDGWRVDSPMNNYDPQKVTSDHTRMKLLRSVKKAITRVKPSTVLMAEIPGPEIMWGKDDRHAQPLFDEMCEGSYNYRYCGILGGMERTGKEYVIFDGALGQVPERRTALDRIVHGEMNSQECVASIRDQAILYDRLRMHFIETHDTARVSAIFPEQHRALFVLIAGMPGVPVIHAGQEIGSTVRPDASGATQVGVDWTHGDLALEGFYRKVVRTRATHKALISGDIENVWKSGEKSIAFLRTAGASRVLVTLNFNPRPVRFMVSLPLGKAGLEAHTSYQLRDELTGETTVHHVEALASLEIHLPPYGYRMTSIAPAT